jgi:hypothetical protein
METMLEIMFLKTFKYCHHIKQEVLNPPPQMRPRGLCFVNMKHHRGHHVNMVAVSILIFAF